MEVTAPALLEIGGVLVAAAAAGWIARRAGLPAVLGYLALGLVVSPFTSGFVADRDQLQVFADVGVVLLLFEVGIEVDLGRLRREHGPLLWVGPAQTVISAAVVAAVFLVLKFEPLAAALMGLVVALSSSVVIVNITRSSRRTTDRATEQAALGWSILQDLTGVGITLVLVALVSPTGQPAGQALVSIVIFVLAAIAAARLLPIALRAVGADDDLFLVISVGSGLALAAAGSVLAGIPLALSAFIAGLVITDSDVASRARRSLLPFRDVFALLFFVAIGALVDPRLMAGGIGWLVLLLALVVLAKVAVAYGLSRLSRLKARPLQLAVAISQIGEFSFVLASLGLAGGLLPEELHAAVIGAVALTIAASTVLVRLVPRSTSAVADSAG